MLIIKYLELNISSLKIEKNVGNKSIINLIVQIHTHQCLRIDKRKTKPALSS